jgi:hypothetical protein
MGGAVGETVHGMPQTGLAAVGTSGFGRRLNTRRGGQLIVEHPAGRRARRLFSLFELVWGAQPAGWPASVGMWGGEPRRRRRAARYRKKRSRGSASARRACRGQSPGRGPPPRRRRRAVRSAAGRRAPTRGRGRPGGVCKKVGKIRRSCLPLRARIAERTVAPEITMIDRRSARVCRQFFLAAFPLAGRRPQRQARSSRWKRLMRNGARS